MRASRVKLTDFRNIPYLETALCEESNVIYGDNGQGKTNFIEGIWMFTGAKSFRGAKDPQLVRFGAQKASLELDFFGDGREQTASLSIEGRRRASLNEIPLKAPSQLAGRFCAVVFSPVDLGFIKNGPQEKRRFIDASICQLKPKYIHALSQFSRVLDQRNRLLKDLAYTPSLLGTLDVWDARFAALAAVVLKTRYSYLEKLRPFAQSCYEGISGGREQLGFTYLPTLPCPLEGSIQELEAPILKALWERREEDLRARSTTAGPHRDDLEVTLNGASARVFGSQGQKRSCVLAMKLAECELTHQVTGEYPVVLLDDVMSELDDRRRDYLLNHLRGMQLLITCCDRNYLKGLDQGLVIKLEGGQITACETY